MKNKLPLTTDTEQSKLAATKFNMMQETNDAANTFARHETVTNTVQIHKNPRGEEDERLSNNSNPMANTKNIYQDKPNNLPSDHWAPNITFPDTNVQNPNMEHHTARLIPRK